MSLRIASSTGEIFDGQLPENKSDFGKTKDVFQLPEDKLALRHNGVLTAYDNPDFTGIAPDKGVTSAYSSALLFKRLEAAGVKTSHQGVLNANTTIETALDMLPFELVWRRYNVKGNSWAKRNPGSKYQEGEKYDEIIYEACLKWSVITKSGEIVHDPFLLLDEDFRPLLRADGLPRLMHSKNETELDYITVLHPNKGGEMSQEAVKVAIDDFASLSGEIREILGKVQKITFDTYAQVGRLNADGKIELGRDAQNRLTLGDELELDALRNMSLQKIDINGETYFYEDDILGTSLEEVLGQAPETIRRIIEAKHSGKQHYRDQVGQMRDAPYDEERRSFNNQAAQTTTKEIYIPVAQALSQRFSGEVELILMSS